MLTTISAKTNVTPLRLAGILVLFATVVPAQTPTEIVDKYIAAVDMLTFQLEQMPDAHNAQAYSSQLPNLVANVNSATADVKSLYGNTAAQAVLTAKSAAMSASQAKLAAEQTRLLTGDCPLEGTAKSGNGPAISPNVENRSAVTLRYYWLDYAGKRTGGGELKAGQSMNLGTYVTHPFIFVDPDGRCVRLLSFSGSGGLSVISELLAPTVGTYLGKLQK